MTAPLTMKYRASFRTARRNEGTEEVAEPISPPKEQPVCRAARLLALAYYVERLIETGVLKSYSDAARRFGISPGRMTVVMNLRLLPVEMQDQLLTGELRCSERSLRPTKRSKGTQKRIPLVLKRNQPMNL